MEKRNLSWAEATQSSAFVKLESDKTTQLKIVDWELNEVVKKFNGAEETHVEFTAKVIEQDGEKTEKTFSTVSSRLKTKLRAVLETLDPSEPVVIRCTKIGSQFSTNYLVERAA